MLGWAIAFMIAAILVAILGMVETATTVAAISKVLFWVFVAGCVYSFVAHFSKSRV